MDAGKGGGDVEGEDEEIYYNGNHRPAKEDVLLGSEHIRGAMGMILPPVGEWIEVGREEVVCIFKKGRRGFLLMLLS